MARLLKDSLPIPPPAYNQGIFNQLIRKLQLILRVGVQTTDEAEEQEAIDFFLTK